jgi:hypothetical protein
LRSTRADDGNIFDPSRLDSLGREELLHASAIP